MSKEQQAPQPAVDHLIDQVLVRIATQRLKLKDGKLKGKSAA